MNFCKINAYRDFHTNYIKGNEKNILMTLVMTVALTLLAVMVYHWISYTMSPVSQLSPRVYFPVMCGLLAMNAIFVCLLSCSIKRKDVDLQSDTQ